MPTSSSMSNKDNLSFHFFTASIKPNESRLIPSFLNGSKIKPAGFVNCHKGAWSFKDTLLNSALIL